MASVAQISQSPQYDADVVLQRSGNIVKIVFGATAEHVDRISFHLMSDPTLVHTLMASGSTVQAEGTGVYLLTRDV